MSNLTGRLTWASGLLMTLWVVGGTGCLESDTPGVCSADITASVHSLEDATAALIVSANDLKFEVATACAAIATDLGQTGVPAITAEVTDEEARTACQLAIDGINAELEAGVTIDVLVQGGYCEVNAEAQFSCEAECTVEGECDPGSIETRCDPGYLSVECDGECTAGAYCQGSVDVEANCVGSCEGACNGTCDASPIEGAECVGTCDGTCTGECHLDADVNVECGAEVRCRGGCTVEGQAPRCETEIEPPECDIEADCQAGCDGQASFEAECYPPEVLIIASGGVDPEAFIATLEANLPSIYNAFEVYGPLIVDQAEAVANAAADTLAAANDTVLCGVLVAGDVGVNMAAAANASVSVSVSVSVSAEVGGSVEAQ